MAVAQLDFPEETLESEFFDQSLSVWKGKGSPCYGLDDFTPVPLDLHTACSIGHSSIVQLISNSQKETLDGVNKGGWTPLMYASYIGHELVVQQLVEAGVSVNSTNHKGQSPLALATSCGNDKTAELLIKRNANIEARDKKGWTPLFHATYSGHQNMVQLLVSHGADINAVEYVHGLTPLIEASAAGHAFTVQFFLQHGANVYAKSRSGATALTEAAANGHTEIVNILNRHLMSAKSHLGASITEGPKAFAWLMNHIGDESDLPLPTVSDLWTQLSDVDINSCSQRPSVSRVDGDDDDDTAFTHSAAVTIRTRQSPVNNRLTHTAVTGTVGHAAGLSSSSCLQFSPTDNIHNSSSVNTTYNRHCQHAAAVSDTEPHVTNAAYDLRAFLSELGLDKYADVFYEQDVDLPMFLTLNEDNLKEIGISLFGPRRKMMTAISQWNNARCGHQLEMSATTHQAGDELDRVRSQLEQERQLRAVTEACLMDDRVAWQHVSEVVSETLQHCDVLRDRLSVMSCSCVDLARTVQHSPPVVQQITQQLQSTCNSLLHTVSDIVMSMHSLTKSHKRIVTKQL